MADVAALTELIEPEVEAEGLGARARQDDRRHVRSDPAGDGRAARHPPADARGLRAAVAAAVRARSTQADPIEDELPARGQLAGHRPAADPAARIIDDWKGHEARITPRREARRPQAVSRRRCSASTATTSCIDVPGPGRDRGCRSPRSTSAKLRHDRQAHRGDRAALARTAPTDRRTFQNGRTGLNHGHRAPAHPAPFPPTRPS